MFLKYVDFIFAPFRAIQNKIVGVQNVKGNIKVDINRAKSMGQRGKNMANQVGAYNQQLNQAGGQGAQMQQGQGAPPGAPQMPGAPGMPPGAPGMPPGMPGMPPGAPGMPPQQQGPAIRYEGFWIFKKAFCTQCGQQLDKSWPHCPYCVEIAKQAAIPPQTRQAMKTQAFVLDPHGGSGGTQLLGWIVPLQGAQRGELFTLQPRTTIGSDPKSTIVLTDHSVSSQHAEIKAENGVWVLRDPGSTNRTYVNNRVIGREDRHELVDNDFVKFGNAMVKFKCL